MTIEEILPRFDNVKSDGHGGWMCSCPGPRHKHGDRNPSLHVSLGDDRILMNCFCGDTPEEICEAMGIQVSDLFFGGNAPKRISPPKRVLVDTYSYLGADGTVVAQKLRYRPKFFQWRYPDGKDGWVWKKPPGLQVPLFIAGKLEGSNLVALTEGEKDAQTAHKKLGLPAVSAPSGAAARWNTKIVEPLKGKSVFVFPDNDAAGVGYARAAAEALTGVAREVKVIAPADLWPEIPEHGDLTDLLDHFGDDGPRIIHDAMRKAPVWQPPKEDPPVEDTSQSEAEPLSVTTLDTVTEERPRWLIPGFLPQGQIVLLAGDGGTGKSTLWANIAAAVSSGRPSILDAAKAEGAVDREPRKVLYLSSEDSTRVVIRRKLRLCGARLENISTIMGDDFQMAKFGSAELAATIRQVRPALAIFDPIQSFLDSTVHMCSRNEMRNALAPLISLGEETGTTFLLIAHTNKRKGVSGRDRISDSSDLWDIARSVMITGYDPENQGIRYLSCEKSSYGPLPQTIMYTIDDLGVHFSGLTDKRDRDFVGLTELAVSKPKRQDCERWLFDRLSEAGEMAAGDLEMAAKAAGYSSHTLRRVKESLKREGSIEASSVGFGKDKRWILRLADGFRPTADSSPDPWTGGQVSSVDK